MIASSRCMSFSLSSFVGVFIVDRHVDHDVSWVHLLSHVKRRRHAPLGVRLRRG
jgi:hypothetical protein